MHSKDMDLTARIAREEDHRTQFISTQATRVNWQEGCENDESCIYTKFMIAFCNQGKRAIWQPVSLETTSE